MNQSGKAVGVPLATKQALKEIAKGAGRGSAGLALFAHALPPEDPLARDALHDAIEKGQTPKEWDASCNHAWRSELLIEAGYTPVDPTGAAIFGPSGRALTAGPVMWRPAVPLIRVHDADTNLHRQLHSEVALAAMLKRQLDRRHLPWSLVRSIGNPNTRGAAFKHGFAMFIANHLDDQWEVRSEVRLNTIYGLHMRRDVGKRSSDVAVIGPPNRRLFAVISSKASWRSDRGTEAAQMVPLRKYRPDVPYAMVTAEFPRVRDISQESAEDRIYHLVPHLWAGWYAARLAFDHSHTIQSLDELDDEASNILQGFPVADLDDLLDDLKAATVAF